MYGGGGVLRGEPSMGEYQTYPQEGHGLSIHPLVGRHTSVETLPSFKHKVREKFLQIFIIYEMQLYQKDDHSLSQPQPDPASASPFSLCLFYIVCMFFPFSKFNKDHNSLLILAIWLNIVSSKKYGHFIFWLRLSQRIPKMSGPASAKAFMCIFLE